VPGPLIVDARIDIEAGAELHMGTDSALLVGLLGEGGQVVVTGTADAPVRFVGIDATGGDTRFEGIDIGTLAQHDTTVEHAIFTRCGGRDDGGAPITAAACIRMGSTDGGTLDLSHVAFEDAARAVRLSGDGEATRLSDLSFDADTSIGLQLPADQVGVVGGNLPFANPAGFHEIEDGTVSRVTADATWAGQPVAWRMSYDLVVTGDGSLSTENPGPTLTLDAGFVLELPEGRWLEVGTEGPAAIETTGTATDPVTLRPTQEGTRMGGLRLGDSLSGANLAGLHLIDGGGGGSEGASMRIDQVEDTVEIGLAGVVFDSCAETGLTTLDADYLRFQTFSGNTFRDCAVPLLMRPDTMGSISADQIWDGDTFVNVLHPGPFTRDATWLDLGLPLRLGVTWERGDGFDIDATLHIDPGTHLLFDEDTRMTVAAGGTGALVAVGTSTEPISMRASDTEWEGLVFEAGSGGSTLSFVELGDAGQVSDNRIQGCLSASDGATDLIVDTVTFTNCGQSGVGAEGPTRAFASFVDNTFDSMDVGLAMHPNMVSDLLAQSYTGVDHNLLIMSVLSESGTWVDQGIPWRATGGADLEVEADLAISAGFELEFPWVSGVGHGIEVGVDGPGSLTATGSRFNPVRFTSAEASPSAGDWRQISFGDDTDTSALTYVELDYPGRGGRAAIDLNGQSAKVTLTDVTVTSGAGDDIEAD